MKQLTQRSCSNVPVLSWKLMEKSQPIDWPSSAPFWHSEWFSLPFHYPNYFAVFGGGGPRGVAVGWGTAIQALRSRVRFPMVSLEIFHWNNPSGRTMALGLNQPLTEMGTRNIPWWVKVAGAWADSLTTFMCRLSWNIGVSTSWNPQGLSRPEMGDLYLLPLPLSFTLPHSSCFHLLTSQLQGRI